MKRLTLLMITTCALFAGAAHAAEPGLCKSMCDVDKRECRAHVQGLAADHAEGFEMGETNPMARAAQYAVPSETSRTLDNAGMQSRRVAGAGACDDTYLRCTRACLAPDAQSVVKSPSARRDDPARAGDDAALIR